MLPESASWPTRRMFEWVGTRTEVFAVGEPTDRVWSYVVSLQTSDGPLWLKANSSGYRHEGPLLSLLTREVPGMVIEPVAVEGEQGWLLLPDGGPTLAGDNDVERWRSIVVRYAHAQRHLETRTTEMFKVGVPDLRPSQLVRALGEVLANEFATASLTPAETNRLRTAGNAVRRLCRELEEFGVAATWNHDDLKGEHVFSRELRHFDLGDSSVAHPYCSLTQLKRFLAEHGMPLEDVDRVEAAYLEARDDGLSSDETDRAMTLCSTLERVVRARNWLRAGDAALIAYPHHITHHLRQLLSGLEERALDGEGGQRR